MNRYAGDGGGMTVVVLLVMMTADRLGGRGTAYYGSYVVIMVRALMASSRVGGEREGGKEGEIDDGLDHYGRFLFSFDSSRKRVLGFRF